MYVAKGYVRDPISKVLINKDEKDYKDHIFKMEIYKTINNLKNEIEFLRTELTEAKAAIARLEERNNV